MQRTNSVCPKPEDLLLKYVESNDFLKLESLVNESPNILNYLYGPPFYKTIVEIACFDFANTVTQQTLQTLIDLGADIYHHVDMYQGKETLHFAALSGNEQTLRTIAQHIRNTNQEKINATAEGDTALLTLIKESESITSKELNAMKILIQNGIDINKPDKKNISPILHAAKKGQREVIALLLEQPNIDLDSHLLRNKSARNLIAEKNLYPNELPEPLTISNNNAPTKEEVFRLLKSGQETSFIKLEGLENFLNEDDGSETLLQICSRCHSVKAAKHLIDLGADPNRITKKTTDTPLEIAAKNGYHQIFAILITKPDTILKNVLSDLLKHLDKPETEKISFRKCFEILLDKKQIDNLTLNKKDKDLNTPLHYAARYSDHETTLNLLNKGAFLGSVNKFGRLPVEDVEAEILERHFDNCISASSGKIDDLEFTVTFDYKTLVPTTQVKPTSSNMERGEAKSNYTLLQKEQNTLLSEMAVISYLASSREHKKLLKHPLITSFLYMKWNRICYFFYSNLLLYIAVWLSLTPYIFMAYNNPNYESETTSFKAFSYVFCIIVGITFFILTFKELFQLVVSPKKYITQVENLIEVALIISVGFILFQSSPSDDTRKQISAIAILASAFQFVLLVGNHPKMSTSIVMLRTVSYSFFKFFLWHAVLIIAFALSFYTLFDDNSKDENQLSNNKTSEEDNAFDDPGVSLFKTFIMLTGEFDASGIKFDAFPITSRILFVLFIFMIAIVLFNLLNGLAVSDTQLIKSHAEIFSYSSRIEHICYIENMLLGNLIPSRLLQSCKKLCCCCPGTNKMLTLPSRLATRACLFPDYLENYELKVFLNKEGEIVFGKVPCTKKVCLDKKTVRNVRHLLKEKKGEKEGGLDALLEFVKQQADERDTLKLLLGIVKQQQSQIQQLQVGQGLILDKLNVT